MGVLHPYYWVDDHPLLYGNNRSFDPGTANHRVAKYHPRWAENADCYKWRDMVPLYMALQAGNWGCIIRIIG